jgi:hypothetical protein
MALVWAGKISRSNLRKSYSEGSTSTERLGVVRVLISAFNGRKDLKSFVCFHFREFCQKLATALTSNSKSSLERIDLSRNPSAEDRGITLFVTTAGW